MSGCFRRRLCLVGGCYCHSLVFFLLLANFTSPFETLISTFHTRRRCISCFISNVTFLIYTQHTSLRRDTQTTHTLFSKYRSCLSLSFSVAFPFPGEKHALPEPVCSRSFTFKVAAEGSPRPVQSNSSLSVSQWPSEAELSVYAVACLSSDCITVALLIAL